MQTLKGELTKVVIKRSEWLRGEGSGRSYLIRKSDNKKCCVGFALEQAGYERNELLGIHAYDSLRHHFRVHDPFRLQIYKINDAPILTKTEREIKLIKAFKELGISISFVD